MAIERPEIPRDEVIRNLWEAYKKTDEFKIKKRTESISTVHPLIRERESDGLSRIVRSFIEKLQERTNIKSEFTDRTVAEWINEWKRMHSFLFHDVLKECGEFRKGMVRFGSPGDEELHKIPDHNSVHRELSELAYKISIGLEEIGEPKDIDHICKFLAYVHYQFIRIHPFPDGNGRIARAVVDQLSVALGFPPIITGFPRNNVEKKEVYHRAVTASGYDPSYSELTMWIKEQIDRKIESIA